MATTSMDITSFVGKLLEQDDVDALREGVRVLAQAVMETEVSGQIGAAPYERSSERVAYRNGGRRQRERSERVGAGLRATRGDGVLSARSAAIRPRRTLAARW
jgi:transposase-like protein